MVYIRFPNTYSFITESLNPLTDTSPCLLPRFCFIDEKNQGLKIESQTIFFPTPVLCLMTFRELTDSRGASPDTSDSPSEKSLSFRNELSYNPWLVLRPLTCGSFRRSCHINCPSLLPLFLMENAFLTSDHAGPLPSEWALNVQIPT